MFLLAVSGGSSFLTTHHWGFVHCAAAWSPCFSPPPKASWPPSPSSTKPSSLSAPCPAPQSHTFPGAHTSVSQFRASGLAVQLPSSLTDLFPNRSQILFLDALSFITMGLIDMLSPQHPFSFVSVYSVKFLVIFF